MEAVILKGYPLTHKNHPRHTKQDEKGKKKTYPGNRLRKEICLVIEQRGRRVLETQRKQEKQYKWKEGIKVLEDEDWSGFV